MAALGVTCLAGLLVLPFAAVAFAVDRGWLQPPHPATFRAGLLVAEAAVEVWMTLGLLRFFCRAVREEDPGPGVLLEASSRVPSGLLHLAIVLLVVAAGTLLLVVPGVLLALSFALGLPVIADEDAGPIHALRTSRRRMAGRRAAMLRLVAVLLPLAILGAPLLGLGPAWAFASLAAFHEEARADDVDGGGTVEDGEESGEEGPGGGGG